MKKLLLLSLFVVGVSVFIAGCSSVPDHVDLTGQWQYIYGSNHLAATIVLNQDGNKLTGTLNSPGGQYDIDGKVIQDKFTFTAKNEKETITANCYLIDRNSFKGRYLVDNGNSGEILQGRRM